MLCFDRLHCVVLARRKLSDGEPQATRTARDLGKASYVTSVFGIVVAVIILAAAITYVLTVSQRCF